MALWHVYLRRGKVIVPTVARTDIGLYMDVEPVEVSEVSQGEIEAMVSRALARGNPAVPTPPRGRAPPPVVLPYAGVKSWAAFARGTLAWDIVEEGARTLIVPQKQGAPRGWVDDLERQVTLPPGESRVDAARRVAQLVCQAALKEE